MRWFILGRGSILIITVIINFFVELWMNFIVFWEYGSLESVLNYHE